MEGRITDLRLFRDTLVEEFTKVIPEDHDSTAHLALHKGLNAALIAVLDPEEQQHIEKAPAPAKSKTPTKRRKRRTQAEIKADKERDEEERRKSKEDEDGDES